MNKSCSALKPSYWTSVWHTVEALNEQVMNRQICEETDAGKVFQEYKQCAHPGPSKPCELFSIFKALGGSSKCGGSGTLPGFGARRSLFNEIHAYGILSVGVSSQPNPGSQTGLQLKSCTEERRACFRESRFHKKMEMTHGTPAHVDFTFPPGPHSSCSRIPWGLRNEGSRAPPRPTEAEPAF